MDDDVVAELRRAGLNASTTTLDRALYSSDASLYRVVPQAVVRVQDVDDLDACVAVARLTRTPLTMRGAGTSCAGNAVGPGIVVDTRALDRIVAIDPAARTATVEPGVVQAGLQRAAAPHGLRFGPDPSTSSRCTIGGMIGNNACGPRALGYGRTGDNVVDLDLVLGDGRRVRAGDRAAFAGLERLIAATLGTNRTEFGRFSRQVSGYSVEHLLPENGFDVARFWAGTEGTLGVVREATVQLAAEPRETVLVSLGYPSMADAADAVPALLAFSPTACEGFDDRIVDVVRRRKGADAVPELPRGAGYVIVELAGDDAGELATRADAMVRAGATAGAVDARVVNGVEKAALWQIRADAAGLAAIALERPAHAGWEDSAVPPARLGAYLRELDALLAEHRLHALPYGHFGEGCVHLRIDFPLPDTGRYRSFVTAAAKLVAAHGGSMSGEHGDGRARSELLALMYSPAALALFANIKHELDPLDVLNPGVLVAPAPFDADVRLAAIAAVGPSGPFGPAGALAHHCTGVGACTSLAGGGMCPSFRATREEKDSTRGRARVLQEMVNGTLVDGGWRSPEVAEALELCLACKACRRECPTGVDMAALKSEALDERHRGRLRPRSHYSLGWLPRWTRLLGCVPGLAGAANLVLGSPLATVAKALAGVDARRSLPRLEPAGFGSLRTLTQLRSPRDPLWAPRAALGTQRVALWVDSFSQGFSLGGAAAAIALLQQQGFDVELLDPDACCGLTWTTTGQRGAAAKRLAGLRRALQPFLDKEVPVIGLEPSCVAQAREQGLTVLTLAELLMTIGYEPPSLVGHTVVVQPHCHHSAIMTFAADAALLAASGAKLVRLHGCCGLAGNFGVERGHHEVSVAVAELELLPALRQHADAIVLADGFSCRTQVEQLASRESVTLAELLLRHS